MSAISSAHDGDTIQLAAGEYTLSKIQNLSFATGVTITSADPAHEAVLDGVLMQNVSGLTFSNLSVKVDDKQGGAVILNGGSNDHFTNLDIHGTAVGDGGGVKIANGTNVTLSNLNIHDVSGGIALSNSNNVSVTNNSIHDLQIDGIQSTGTSNVTISGNTFTNFSPKAGNHSDAIQFFTSGQTTSAHDITITDNTYTRGTGAADTQGIFMGDEAKVHYQNVDVSGNAIVGGVYQGIMIDGANNLTFNQNLKVEGYTDQVSWVLLTGDSNVTETNNISTSFNAQIPNTNVTASNNITIAPGKVGDTSLLASHDSQSAVASTGATTVTSTVASTSSLTSAPVAAPSVVTPAAPAAPSWNWWGSR